MTFSLVPSVSTSLLETGLERFCEAILLCTGFHLPVSSKINILTGSELQTGNMRQWKPRVPLELSPKAKECVSGWIFYHESLLCTTMERDQKVCYYPGLYFPRAN